MTKEMDFFVFLLEQYAKHKGTTADKVIMEWDSCGITERIYNSYEIYHQEALDNAFADIEHLSKTGTHAW